MSQQNPVDRALPPLGYTSSPDGSSQISKMTHSPGQEQSALTDEAARFGAQPSRERL